jgi:hypothetical protein
MSQFFVLLHRTFLVKTRDPVATMTQLFTATTCGLIFGAVYWQVYENDGTMIEQVLDAQMALSFSIVMIAFLPFDVLLTFPKERRMYLREHFGGLYSTSAFFFARVLCDVPALTASGVILIALVKGMGGLRADWGSCLSVSILSIHTGTALLQFVGAISMNFDQANGIATLFLMMFMMVSPAFLRNCPKWLRWLYDISFIGQMSGYAAKLEFDELEDATELGEFKAPEDVDDAIIVCLVSLAITRSLTYLAVRFLHTGRPWVQLKHD